LLNGNSPNFQNIFFFIKQDVDKKFCGSGLKPCKSLIFVFFLIFFKHFYLKRCLKHFVSENISVYYTKMTKKSLLADTRHIFYFKKHAMTFLLYGKPVSKVMKTVIDFLKILVDTAPYITNKAQA
jgi:hypothetical protein